MARRGDDVCVGGSASGSGGILLGERARRGARLALRLTGHRCGFLGMVGVVRVLRKVLSPGLAQLGDAAPGGCQNSAGTMSTKRILTMVMPGKIVA